MRSASAAKVASDIVAKNDRGVSTVIERHVKDFQSFCTVMPRSHASQQDDKALA